MNPGGSVKDRAAKAIVLDAEARGLLRPGGVIVEGTAGNTGIGLALVANSLGYRTVIVIPDTQSQEKKDMLRLCGADLREVPAVPYRDENNYVKFSGRLAEKLAKTEANGAIWAISLIMLPTEKVITKTLVPKYLSKPMVKLMLSFVQLEQEEHWPEPEWHSKNVIRK